MNKQTTEEQFELFCSEASRWINHFGLVKYEIDFEHSNKYPGNLGACLSSQVEMCATLYLLKDWGDTESEPTDELVAKIAFHEVMELWFSRFYDLAQSRYIREDELEMERHSMIQTLQNLIWEMEDEDDEDEDDE